MKCKRLFVGFLLSMFVLQFSCKTGSGEIDKGGREEDDKTYTIKLASDKILAKKGSTQIQDGYKAKAGDLLSFRVSDANLVVESWIVNGKKIANTSNTEFSYKVAEPDADEKGNIRIDFKIKGEEKILIKFDSSKMKCKRGASDVMPNEEVKLNDVLIFTAQLQANENVDKWQVNGIAKDDQTEDTFHLTVAQNDVKDGVINVSYSVKLNKVITIKYDENTTTCKKGSLVCKDGDVIHDGDVLVFEAKNVIASHVEGWYVKNQKQAGTALNASFKYTVKEADVEKDGEKDVIKVMYKLKELITVNFGSDIEKCVEPGSILTPEVKIQSGDKVAVGTSLTFTAKLLADEAVEKWLINGNVQTGSDKDFRYKVKKDDAKDGVITVSCTKITLRKAIISFDASLMTCSDAKTYKPVLPNQEVHEGDTLKFLANLKEGYDITNWKVGNTDKLDQKTSRFSYVVNLSDGVQEAGGTKITISYVETERAKYKIHFDSAKMSCKKGYGASASNINPDEQIHEDIQLTFTAILQDGDEIDKWIVKGVDTTKSASSFYYLVKGTDAEGDTITISYRLSEKYELSWGNDIEKAEAMTQSFFGGYSYKKIESGYKAKAGEKVRYTAKLEDGKAVASWSVGSTVQQGEKDKEFIYTVAKTDVDTGTKKITVSVAIEDASSATIEYDGAKIKCTKDGEDCASGSQIKQGDKLSFKVIEKFARGSAFDKWTINNTPKDGASATTFEYIVDKADITSGNNKVAVAYNTKQLPQFKINFASPITKCVVKSNSQSINTGDIAYEGEQLKFTCENHKNADIQDWFVKNKRQSGWSKYAYFDYKVKADDGEGSSGTQEINVACTLVEKVKIVFNDPNMTCKYYYSSDGKVISSGDLVLPSKWIQFTVTLEEGQKVKLYKFNGNEVQKNGNHYWEGEGNKIFHYYVSLDNAVVDSDGTKKVEVSYELE